MLLIGNGIAVLGLIKERFLVVAVLHVSAQYMEVQGGVCGSDLGGAKVRKKLKWPKLRQF